MFFLVLKLRLVAGTQPVAWLCFNLLQMHSEKNLQLVEVAQNWLRLSR